MSPRALFAGIFALTLFLASCALFVRLILDLEYEEPVLWGTAATRSTSAQSGVRAWCKSVGGGTALFIGDTEGGESSILATHRHILGMALSHSGEDLAFVISDAVRPLSADMDYEIWPSDMVVCSTRTGILRRLPCKEGRKSCIAWSPDDAKLACINVDGDGTMDMVVWDLAGADRPFITPVGDLEDRALALRWARRGGRIGYLVSCFESTRLCDEQWKSLSVPTSP